MSFVQDISNSVASVTNTTIAQTITGVTGGNLLRVVVAYLNSGGQTRTLSVSDGTNSFSAATSLFFDSSNDEWGIQEFYFSNYPASSPTITATLSGISTAQYIYIQERSNIATTSALNVGGTPSNTVPGASGANVIIANSITTTGGGTTDVCGFVIHANGTSPAITTGTTLAWTGRTANTWTPQGGSGTMASEDLSAQTAGAYVATFGLSSVGDRYYCYGVAYNNPGGGGGTATIAWVS